MCYSVITYWSLSGQLVFCYASGVPPGVVAIPSGRMSVGRPLLVDHSSVQTEFQIIDRSRVVWRRTSWSAIGVRHVVDLEVSWHGQNTLVVEHLHCVRFRLYSTSHSLKPRFLQQRALCTRNGLSQATRSFWKCTARQVKYQEGMPIVSEPTQHRTCLKRNCHNCQRGFVPLSRRIIPVLATILWIKSAEISLSVYVLDRILVGGSYSLWNSDCSSCILLHRSIVNCSSNFRRDSALRERSSENIRRETTNDCRI